MPLFSRQNVLQTLQLLILSLVFVFLLVSTPQYWIQYPDSGFYIGTAQQLLDSFEYRFNGQPNLLYYPGTSVVVAAGLALFGENFHLLQGLMAVISLAGVLAIARYFKPASYGVVGLFTPFFVLFSGLFIIHFYALISDTLFLAVTMFALLCWRKYDTSQQMKYLFLCCLLVAFSSVIRLQGLFFCAALGLALMIHAYQNPGANFKLTLGKMMLLGGAVCLPFVLWTARNYFAHTPDTFNMANGYFFGLKGLSVYAKGIPGNASADHIQAAWQFPLERTSLFVGGLFESWYGGISRFNRYAISTVMLGLVALGLAPWAKKANKLELLYVGFSMLFICKDILLNKNLHIVYRYWIPMLPFIVVMMGMGIKTCISFNWLRGFKRPAQYLSVVAVSLLLVVSTPNLLSMHQQSEKLKSEQLLLEQVKAFAQTNIPDDAVMATVDWGVLPYTLQRYSIPLLNDPDNQQSVARMLKYQTDYLVIYSKFARMSDPAEQMVERFPGAFSLQFEATAQASSNRLAVYKVDLTILKTKI